MSYPIFPDKHTLQPIVTAEQMLEFRRGQGGLKGLSAPEGVVLCLYNGVMKHFGWKYPSRQVRSFQCDLHLLKRPAGKVAVAGNFGMGAPAVVALSEQLAAWGTKRLVILGLAGALQEELEPGSIVLGERAIRDEGTSYHYLPPAEQVQAGTTLPAAIAGALAARGLPYSGGAVWSTDGAYRETHEEARYYQGKGVQAVDMESAGLFALGQVKGLETASLLVVGQSLVSPRRVTPGGTHPLHERFKQLLKVLVDVLGAA